MPAEHLVSLRGFPPLTPSDAAGLAARARRYGPLPARDVPPPPPLPAPPGLGAAIGALIDRWWRDAGAPDPFPVVVEGPHVEVLPDVLAGTVAARGALRLVAVVPEPAERARLGTRVVLEPAALVLGQLVAGESDDDDPTVVPGQGPLATAIEDVPALVGAGVRLAVLALSAMAADRWVRQNGEWQELRVAAAAGSGLRVIAVPGEPPASLAAVGTGPDGAGRDHDERLVVPVAEAAAAWVAEARSQRLGVVAVVDVFHPSANSMAGPAPARGVALDQIDPAGTGRRGAGDPARPLPAPLGLLEWRQ